MAISKEKLNLYLNVVTIGLPVLMFAVDVMALAVGLHPIMTELKVDAHTVQWLLTAYAIGNAAFLVTMGKVADNYGRKIWLMIGIAIFMITSLLAGLSSDIYIIILCRALQGFSGATMITASLAIITHCYKGEARTFMMGKYVMLGGVGGGLGPALGGVLIHYFSWRAIFFINVPIGCLSLLFCWFVLKRSKEKVPDTHFDIMGMLTLTIALVAIVLGLCNGNVWGWLSWENILCYALTIIFACIFVCIELRVKEPMIDFALFKRYKFFLGSFIGFSFYFLYFSWLFLFGLFMQQSYGLTPLEAGLTYLPVTLIFAVGNNYIQHLVKWISIKRLLQLGAALMAVGFLMLAFVSAQTPFYYILIAYVILGIGSSGLVSPPMLLALNSLPAEMGGIGSGVLFTIRWFGASIGMAIIGAVYQASAHSHLLDGLRHMGAHTTEAQRIALGNILSGILSNKDIQYYFPHAVIPVTNEVNAAIAYAVMISCFLLFAYAIFCLLVALFKPRKA